MATVLVITPSPEHRAMIETAIQQVPGYDSVFFDDLWRGIDYALWQSRPGPDAVIITASPERPESLEAIQSLLYSQGHMPVLALIGRGSPAYVSEVLSAGAQDYLEGSFSVERLSVSLENMLKLRELRSRSGQWAFPFGISLEEEHYTMLSEYFSQTIHQARQAARYDRTLVIEGEKGTGKAILAEAVHHYSRRKDRPFLSVNIERDIPELETTLRHAMGGTIMVCHRGEFTGPSQQLLEKFHHTLLNRDIRLIICRETGTKRMHGFSSEPQTISNLHPQTISLPCLREHQTDIIALAELWLNSLSHNQRGQQEELSDALRQQLVNHHWPENYAELQMTLFKEMIQQHYPGAMNGAEYSSLPLPEEKGGTAHVPLLDKNGKLRSLEDIEKDIIIFALEHYKSRSAAARNLGIGRTTLYRKVQQFERSA